MKPIVILLITLFPVVFYAPGYAGNLVPPAPPHEPASGMYTLEDIYHRLTTGESGSKRAGGFAEPDQAPGSHGKTLDEIHVVLPQKNDAGGAAAADVQCGKTFWGLRGDGWGELVGTRQTRLWYPDSDGDGYGDAGAQPVSACDRPADHVADRTDCNDADPAIHPGAPETDNDGIDSNCDGSDGWAVVIRDDDGWLINLNIDRVKGQPPFAIRYKGELRYKRKTSIIVGSAAALYLVGNDSFTITATDNNPDNTGEFTYSLVWTTGPQMTGGYFYKDNVKMFTIDAVLLKGNVGGHTP